MLGLAAPPPPSSTINATAIRRVVAAIEAQPTRWDQGRYLGSGTAGSVLCFAGWTCFLAGYNVEQMLQADPRCGRIVLRTARTLLGLSPSQAGALFSDRALTLTQFKTVITAVTGVTFDPPLL